MGVARGPRGPGQLRRGPWVLGPGAEAQSHHPHLRGPQEGGQVDHGQTARRTLPGAEMLKEYCTTCMKIYKTFKVSGINIKIRQGTLIYEVLKIPKLVVEYPLPCYEDLSQVVVK